MATRNRKTKVIVSPATDNAHKEGFVKINGKIIVFGIPVELDEQDILAIKRIREPKRVDTGIDVHKLMDQLQLPQEKVNKLLRENADMRTSSNVRYVPKYIVSKA